LVPVAEADDAPEVVLDDAQVIAVIVDVRRELGAVAPADDALLAELRRLPVHFQLELIGLDETRRLGQPFPELPEEEEKAVSLSLVVAERGVARGAAAPLDGAARQRLRRCAVPVLSGGGGRERRHQSGAPASGGEQRTHRDGI